LVSSSKNIEDFILINIILNLKKNFLKE